MTAIREHTEMQQVATRLTKETGKPDKLPSYEQVRREIHRLALQPDLVAMREGAKSIVRPRESAESFTLSILLDRPGVLILPSRMATYAEASYPLLLARSGER